MARKWKVSEVAQVAHVTVRTLHHYDSIGLLVPSDRSDASYRLYAESDLERLHQILLYRELGFTLEAIGRLLDEPAVDRRTELRAQRELLVERRRKTDAVIRAVDRTLQSMERGTTMKTEDMFEGFQDLTEAPPEVRSHHATHAKEANERWGQTDAYKQSMRRAKGYSRKDWDELQKSSAANDARMVSLMSAGADPEGEDAMDCAESMRLHIDRWFYECSPEFHAGLADMYEADARFAEYYEKQAEGLTGFVARAIRANAARH